MRKTLELTWCQLVSSIQVTFLVVRRHQEFLLSHRPLLQKFQAKNNSNNDNRYFFDSQRDVSQGPERLASVDQDLLA